MILKQRPELPSSETNLSVLERVLHARGETAASALDYSLKRLLPPDRLTQIREAAVLLAEAVTAGARITVVGDFDADGATACALTVRCLRSMGLSDVDYLVPNRFEFGYGLSPEIVGIAATRNPDILITVDNGISSIDGVFAAQQLGMSVLVTDHHLPGEEIPTADVIVNPNLPGDKFASKNLAGVGVIFYVMLALRAELRSQGWFQRSGIAEPNMTQFLDLVALGTVADVVPLDRNNRILVHQGVLRIRAGQACAGIQALLTVAKRNPQRVTATDLGFTVGPRLNAAGRLEDMSVGIECLLTDDADLAHRLALQLDELNQARRSVELDMQEQAEEIVAGIQLQETSPPCAYVLADESWHQGVVGLVASRIKERVNRPVIAMAPGDGGDWKGSARSVEGVHIRDVLARVDSKRPGMMSKYGGHAMAAGLSLNPTNIDQFSQLFIECTEEMTKDKDWQQIIWTDGELQPTEFSTEVAETLRTASPWGQAFPEPIFEGRFTVQQSKVVGDRHLKLRLQLPDSERQIDAIAFGFLDRTGNIPDGEVHAAYRLDVNEWQGRVNVQLIIVHLEPV